MNAPEHLALGFTATDRDSAIAAAAAAGETWFDTEADRLDVELHRVVPHTDVVSGQVLSYSIDAYVTRKGSGNFPKPQGIITPVPSPVPADADASAA